MNSTTDHPCRCRRRPQLTVLFLVFAGASFAGAADTPASTDYSHSTQVLDGGGGRQSSADYVLAGSLAGWGGLAASADYGIATGYPAQLNNPPVVPAVAREHEAGTGVRLRLAALVQSAWDPDGDPLAVAEVDATSTLGGEVVAGGGWITYLPPAGPGGGDSFQFTVQDDWGDRTSGWVFLSSSDGAGEPGVNLVALQPAAGDAMVVTLAGVAGRVYRVEAASSLVPPVSWTSLGTVQAAPNGLMNLTDPDAGLHLQRFYRTVLP